MIEKTIVFRADRKPNPSFVHIGFETDNMVERLVFVLPSIHVQQTATLMIDGKYVNMAMLAEESGRYYIDLTAELVGAPGQIDAYITIDAPDGKVWNSAPFALVTGDLPDVDGAIQEHFPDAIQQMRQEIAGHRAEMQDQSKAVQEAADRAEKAAGDISDTLDGGTDGQFLGNVNGKPTWMTLGEGSGGGSGIAKETDPTVPAWAKQPEKPTYTAEEVGAQPKGDYASREDVERLSEEIGDVQFHAAMPEGVVGDGVTDDSAAIQALLDAHDYVYLPKANYYIAAKWLKMLRDGVTFICDGTLIVNTTQAIVLSASHCHVKIAHIKSKYNGTWNEADKWKFVASAFKLHAKTAAVMYNTIEVGYIERCINGFWFVPDGDGMGIAHNVIKFGDVYCERGIYFNPGDQAYVYINGNHFYGGQLRGNHPIFTQKGAGQTDPFNGNTFYHIAMEGCQKPMTLNCFYMNKFADMRIAENENAGIPYPEPLIVLDDESFGNVFETHATLNIDRIVDPIKKSLRVWERWLGNQYIAKALITGEQGASKIAGLRGRTAYGQMIVEGAYNETRDVRNTNLDLSGDKYALIGRTFKCMAESNSVVITLSTGYRYGAATVFYVSVESITSPHTIKVMQAGVEIIPDNVMTEVGLYKAELYTGIGWITTKIDVAYRLPEDRFPALDPETVVEPSTLKMWASWYDSAAAGAGQDTITDVTFSNSYVVTGTEDASWAADVGGTGKITAYRTGTSVVVATTDGAKNIKLNPDCRFMFGKSGSEEYGNFANLVTVSGTELLVADEGTNAEKLCQKNTTLSTPICIPDGVTNINSAFTGCTALTTAPEIPESVVTMRNAFINCSAMQTLPSSIPASVTDMAFAFQSCSSVNGSVEINAQNLSDYGNAFYMAAMNEGCHVTLTGTCPVLAEIAATNSSGKVTAAT